MNKKWLTIGIIIIFIFLTVGITYYYWTVTRIETRNYNPEIVINPQKQYTIEVWDFKNPHIYISEAMQVEVWKKITDEFRAAYPNIQVDVKLLEEEEYLEAIEKGIRNNKMADIVIDWLGTPFIDLNMQMPVHKYHSLTEEEYLKGTIEYVTYKDGIVAYPLIAIPNLLIGNQEILDEYVNVIEIAVEGWSLEHFIDTITKMKDICQYPVSVFDYKGSFTPNLLVQGGVESIIEDKKFSWYGHTLVSWFMQVDKLKNQGLINGNKMWLRDFWQGDIGLLAGAQTWVVTETANRNQALSEGKIRDAASTKQIKTILLPYPYYAEHGNNYGMEQVSAVPFSQRQYKGEDHSKAVMEFLAFMGPNYSLGFSNIPGFIPASNTVTKQWSEQNGLDPYSSRSIQLSAINGRPIKSRYFRDLHREEQALEKVQPILDDYWLGNIQLQEFIQRMSNQ